MDILFDLYQQGQIADAQKTANQAANKADASGADIARISRRLERLSLISQAMWEMLRERAEFTDQQLMDRILEVDLRDGKADGKMAARIVDCHHCKAKTNSRRANCIMCGMELQKDHAFEL